MAISKTGESPLEKQHCTHPYLELSDSRNYNPLVDVSMRPYCNTSENAQHLLYFAFLIIGICVLYSEREKHRLFKTPECFVM